LSLKFHNKNDTVNYPERYVQLKVIQLFLSLLLEERKRLVRSVAKTVSVLWTCIAVWRAGRHACYVR